MMAPADMAFGVHRRHFKLILNKADHFPRPSSTDCHPGKPSARVAKTHLLIIFFH